MYFSHSILFLKPVRKKIFRIIQSTMADIEQQELLELINSKDFDISQCIKYLRIFSNSIGIHHFLIQKLATYNHDEIEFYIPQFVQLLVTYETNSMALEDFLLEYSAKYPHFSLIVFWYLQAYIFELRNDPESYSFQTVRKFINQLQNIMFNPDSPLKRSHEFRENLHPSLVAIGSLVAAFALPSSHQYSLPVIKSQSKQQKSFVFQLANFQKALTKNLTLKNLRLSSDTNEDSGKHSTSSRSGNRKLYVNLARNSLSFALERDSLDDGTGSSEEERYSIDSSSTYNVSSKRLDEIEDNLKINTTIKSKKGVFNASMYKNKPEGERGFLLQTDNRGLSQSLPDLRDTHDTIVRPYISPTESEASLVVPHSPLIGTRISNQFKNDHISYDIQKRTLYVNYARKETDFIMALQNVSFRLSQIPREARLSALRAELSMINETILPSEIDIPQLFPVTSSKNKRYHKILKLNVNEACVLNSAERVPFLLLIEYLSDEFDFDPLNEHNKKIILRSGKRSGVENNTSPLGDSSTPESSRSNYKEQPTERKTEFVNNEADLGDRDSMLFRNGPRDLNKLKLLERKDEIISDTPKSKPLEMPSSVLAGQMRIASVMLKQLEDSGKENSDQSVSIRNRIVESMISLQDQFDAINYEKLNQLKGDDPDAGERKLENDFKLGEDWATKRQRIKRSSIYGHLENWDLCSVIAKNGDDLPQEAFACQLISIVSGIWKTARIPAWTKKMKILITSANTGLVETINNAMSIHSIKKSLTELSITDGDNSRGRIFSLLDYFVKLFGSPTSPNFKSAQENFARSLAAYSILCYIFQIKDRHNGNIMVDNEGHIMHIDFGFILSNSPGSLGFEAAPFKLTSEYIELLGGQNSTYFKMFSDICKQCFKAVRQESDKIIDIVELMQKDSSLPCFNNGESTSVLLKQRLQLHLTDEQCDNFVENGLILKSIGSVYTRLYDQFQMVTQGIYS